MNDTSMYSFNFTKQSKPITLFWIISKGIWGILWRIYANSCWLNECWHLYFLFLIFIFNFLAAIFFSAAAPWTLLSMRLHLRLQRGTNRWQWPRQCYHPHAHTCTINRPKQTNCKESLTARAASRARLTTCHPAVPAFDPGYLATSLRTLATGIQTQTQ